MNVITSSNSDWSVSLLAWGDPASLKTFSGYSAQLRAQLKAQNLLRREYNINTVGATDALVGALSLVPLLSGRRPTVRREWLWSRSAIGTLSRRLNRKIELAGDRGAFLEVGTLARVDKRFGPQFQITDMTVFQAREAGQFGFGHMSAGTVAQAIQAQRETLEHACHIFAMSQWTAESLVSHYGTPENKITVVYTGPNMDPQDEVVQRRPHQILFVGYDWTRKGGPLLLDAFRLVRHAMPDAELVIVGPDPEVREDGIRIAGTLDRRDPSQFAKLKRLYRESACLCLPSCFDPFPIAIVDAMTLGTPVVAFDNGSRREAILDGRTGLLARNGDVVDLSRALGKLLASPDLQVVMSQEARSRARDLFTWERVVERIGTTIRRHLDESAR